MPSRSPSAIDTAAETLLAGAPAFTRQNLFHALRRAQGPASPLTEDRFDAALRRRLARGPLPGLLPAPGARRARKLGRELEACSPKAVLLVDQPAVLDLFVALGVIASARLAVVCIDGTPAPVVAWLSRSFRAGLRVPVAYLHDAATVVYPFSLEPLATLVRHAGDEPLAYADLGLPPLGATARRFDDPVLAGDEPIRELEAIPPATLVRYATEGAYRLIPADPNLLPLAQEGERLRLQDGREPRG